MTSSNQLMKAVTMQHIITSKLNLQEAKKIATHNIGSIGEYERIGGILAGRGLISLIARSYDLNLAVEKGWLKIQ